MKKTVLALTLAASLGLAACSDSSEVIVSSKAGDLTQEEFYNQIKTLAGPQLLEQIMIEKILADKYEVTNKEIEDELKSIKEELGDNYESELANAGLTEKSLKSNIRFNQLKTKAMNDVEVTDEEIQDYYNKAKTELKGRHILVSTEEEAKEIIKQLNEGGDFAEIAKEKSLDTSSGEKGGDLDWFQYGQMVTEFNDAAYSLELNKISEPVKSSYGYHIIQITDKRDIKDFGTLEDKKDQIVEAVKAKKANWDDIVKKLIKEADVKVKDKDLKDAFEDYK